VSASDAPGGEARPAASPDGSLVPPVTGGLFSRIASVGAAAQAAIPGLYAWSVTVAPAAWSRGAPWAAKLAAVIGVLALTLAPVLERWSPNWSRMVSVWGLVTSSSIVWLLAPAGLAPGKLDPLPAIAGMIGWGLFALASSAPALRTGARAGNPRFAAANHAGQLRPRAPIPQGDLAYVLLGVVLAGSLQIAGWRAMPAERALLVRMVALVGGLIVLGAVSTIATSRHARAKASARLRVRRALPWLLLLGVLAAAGTIILLR